AVRDHAVEARAELLGRDAREHPLELDEATRARGEVTNDQQRPFVADEVERPRIWGPLVIRMTLGGRRSRDGSLQIRRRTGESQHTGLGRNVIQDLLRQFSAEPSLDSCMGQVIDLAERREAAQRKTRTREPVRAQLFFDLACPFTYLATERVERAFSHVTWTATSSETLQRRCLA